MTVVFEPLDEIYGLLFALGCNFASKFLIENGADVNCIDPNNLQTCLHILSNMNVANAVSMSDVAELLIKKKIDLNKVDSDGK